MQAAFFFAMSTTGSIGDGGSKPAPVQHQPLVPRAEGSSTRIAGKETQKASTRRRPSPTHFLSVRVDNPKIWEKVSLVQKHVSESHPHLEQAAIPVQDLHLTLFVATLLEKDGSLQRARDTLRQCRDILIAHGLPGDEPFSSARASRERGPRHASACLREDSEKAGPVHRTHDADDANETARSAALIKPSEDKREQIELRVSCRAGDAGGDDVLHDEQGRVSNELTLSFHGLDTFRNKVLFACLEDDEQAARFRRLAYALHDRFGQAGLLWSVAKEKDNARSEGRQPEAFDFTPHLTVMKTSRLANRQTKIPAACFEGLRTTSFGFHKAAAIELSSMSEKEDSPAYKGWGPRPYYKCEEKICL